jgi:hypothetical protein
MFMIAANFISSWPMMAENGYTGRAVSASTAGSATARVATRRRGLRFGKRDVKKRKRRQRRLRAAMSRKRNESAEIRVPLLRGLCKSTEKKKESDVSRLLPTFRRSFGDPRGGRGGETHLAAERAVTFLPALAAGATGRTVRGVVVSISAGRLDETRARRAGGCAITDGVTATKG